MRYLALALAFVLSVFGCRTPSVYPAETWQTRSPAEVGLDVVRLRSIAATLGGRGAIVRRGFLVFTWGDAARPGDIASAAKPFYSHFLFEAVEQGLLDGVDDPVVDHEPCLGEGDRGILFRHLATQTSGYGVTEAPGTAFDYNDWQMALFWDTLFLRVWDSSYATIDEDVLAPYLGEVLGFEDEATLMAFGTEDRPGRLAVSPRDACRFGLLYLRRGRWENTQVIPESWAVAAVSEPLPRELPRTAAVAAEMCPGQRSIGSAAIPDDQTDHHGSYSWAWWVNGVGRDGTRRWPDAEPEVFAALGHRNGKRGLAVVPSLDVVMAWNDTWLDALPEEPHPLNEVFRLLYEAAD